MQEMYVDNRTLDLHFFFTLTGRFVWRSLLVRIFTCFDRLCVVVIDGIAKACLEQPLD
jgi:hypothetical protein